MVHHNRRRAGPCGSTSPTRPERI